METVEDYRKELIKQVTDLVSTDDLVPDDNFLEALTRMDDETIVKVFSRGITPEKLAKYIVENLPRYLETPDETALTIED